MLLRLSVPFSIGSLSRQWADQQHHQRSASGIGDVSVLAETWLLSPQAHESGNISVGIDVKAPTGKNDVSSQFFTATDAVQFPADQTIQPGDGGWALLVQGQAFRQVGERVIGYAFGSYMANPTAPSSIVTTSALLWGLSVGSFSRHRMTSAAIAGGESERIEATDTGTALMCAAMI